MKGRLASRVLGLHLERSGRDVRLYDSSADRWLPTPQEQLAQTEAARQRAEAKVTQVNQAWQQAQADAAQANLARQQAEAETERLRRELEALRRKS